jgi:hypothetical protein
MVVHLLSEYEYEITLSLNAVINDTVTEVMPVDKLY